MVSWGGGGANAFKMASEYDTLTSEMSIEMFSKWKVDQLKVFLKRRGVILSGRKAELAKNAYYAWKLKLEVAKTTQDEEDDYSTRRREKLTIESGFLFVELSFDKYPLRYNLGSGYGLVGFQALNWLEQTFVNLVTLKSW